MDFYKIKNNTSNPLMINGTYIQSQQEVLIGDIFLDKIDNKYFETEILINKGKVIVDEPIHIDPPRVLSTIIRERNLETSIRDSLLKGIEAYNIIQDKIGYNQLKPSIQEIIDSLGDTTFKTYWKDPVSLENLLPNKESGLNFDGDIRLVLSNNSLHRWDESEQKWKQVSFASSGGEVIDNVGNYSSPILDKRFVLDEFFAYDGQQIFNLKGKYILNSNDLQVILNGILLNKDVDYIEVKENVVQFLYPLKSEDYVVFSTFGKESIPHIVVENHIINESKNKITLNKSIGKNPKILQIYLNGIALIYGEDADYIIENNKDVIFDFQLEEGDIVLARFEFADLIDNFELEFAQNQRVYMNLSKQVQNLREIVENHIK